ncbi:MAG: C-GCAxxG-C-C family protein, partial [Treponema sp.]|nr:C-GCAxxG-C-C family protein [Treponema sp.]
TMKKPEQAVQNFQAGCNCAQAVLTAYAEDFNLDKNLAKALATGFGAGIGRSQGVCGAVSGGVMVLGLKYGSRENDGREKINAAYDIVGNYLREFKSLKGSIACLELLSGCNLSTDEGKRYFKEHNLREACYGYVKCSCDILERIFAQEPASS